MNVQPNLRPGGTQPLGPLQAGAAPPAAAPPAAPPVAPAPGGGPGLAADRVDAARVGLESPSESDLPPMPLPRLGIRRNLEERRVDREALERRSRAAVQGASQGVQSADGAAAGVSGAADVFARLGTLLNRPALAAQLSRFAEALNRIPGLALTSAVAEFVQGMEALVNRWSTMDGAARTEAICNVVSGVAGLVARFSPPPARAGALAVSIGATALNQLVQNWSRIGQVLRSAVGGSSPTPAPAS